MKKVLVVLAMTLGTVLTAQKSYEVKVLSQTQPEIYTCIVGHSSQYSTTNAQLIDRINREARAFYEFGRLSKKYDMANNSSVRNRWAQIIKPYQLSGGCVDFIPFVAKLKISGYR